MRERARTFPALISVGDGMRPSLSNSEALTTTGSFCMLLKSTHSEQLALL